MTPATRLHWAQLEFAAAYRAAQDDLRPEQIKVARIAARELREALAAAVYQLKVTAQIRCQNHPEKRALYRCTLVDRSASAPPRNLRAEPLCTKCAFAEADARVRDEHRDQTLMAWWHDLHDTRPR